MADSTRSRKQFWEHSSTPIYILIAVTLVFACISHVDSFSRDDDKGAVNCSRSRTCTKCAERPLCSWSLERQTCVDMTQKPELLMVNVRGHCPRLTAIDTFAYKTLLPFTYRVKISNDVSGFVKYLAKTNVTCTLKGVRFNGTVNEDADTIDCAAISNEHLGFGNQRLMIYHYSVEFDGVPLRFDDGVNNYFTVYNTHFCKVDYRAKDCVACSWESARNAFFYKRCSAGNACTGLFEYYDRQNTTAEGVRTSGGRNDDDYDDDDAPAAEQPADGLYEPPADACGPDMTIESVEPLTAPWSGGTTLVITVKSHELLAEGRKATVTVAGRDCVYPKTVNGETITCTVGPPKPEDLAAGPVRVVYGPLRLTSAQTFRFIYPEPTALSPACGPVSGGTLLRIAGRFMDAGSTVTVSVGPANVPCELLARREDHALCLTGPADGPSAGSVTVVFDKSLRRTVSANDVIAQFVYAGDPVLDARQPFAGIASGGTYVPVRGRHLTCVSNATLYVDDADGVRHSAGCEVRNDTFMECRSPALDAPEPPTAAAAVATSVSLNFGFRVRFAGHVLDLSPQPDYPGYRMYADPAFADFETNGRNVTINGRHLDRGYRPEVDLVVRLRDDEGPECAVVETQRRRIVCVRPPYSPASDDLHALHVTIGHDFVRTVKRKNDGDLFADGSMDAFCAFLLVTAGVLTGVCLVSSLVIVVYAVWYKKCDIRRYL